MTMTMTTTMTMTMTWQAMGLSDIARHVKGCHLTQQTRVQNACR
jgi:hypothetical protein